MQKKRSNVSLAFAIVAVVLALGSAVWRYLYYGVPFGQLLVMLAEYYVPGFLIAFIVPVFVAIGRRAPKAKTPLAVIAFIFLGIQCVLNIVYIFTNGSLVRIGRWALSNLINGSHVLTGIGALLRGYGWQFVIFQSLFIIAEIFFVLKNLLGAIALCRRERSAAPAQPYYAPQYAQAPQYAAPAAAPAPPKFCP
ncbi:MAG: hypothetical protein J6P71_04025, partial [Oscillospiraceae bacterium]|nr:hypothetical protein [Oscillospiraceae bacterium]